VVTAVSLTPQAARDSNPNPSNTPLISISLQ